ncbi:MAG: hypothetical protein N2652_11555 [Kiritimatiellae bacterium]|nr:hypothetical protein [Kiritimatiellia bacterium]
MRAWLFWAGILLGADALVGLLAQRWWASRLPGLPIAFIATVEAVLAIALLAAYLALSPS